MSQSWLKGFTFLCKIIMALMQRPVRILLGPIQAVRDRINTRSIITLGVCLISCVSQVLSAFITEPCGSVQPIYGMVLKRHVFQSLKTLNSLRCSKACDNEIRCQSFNYFVTKEVCELNNRTREAKLDDLVQEKDGLYMKRFNKRGRYVILIQTIEITLHLQIFEERDAFWQCT